MKGNRNMISSRLTTLALALATFNGVSNAQETLKIATINLEKVNQAYWKTQMSAKQVNERGADFKRVEQGMLDDLKQIAEEHARLMQSIEDPANSKAKRETDMQKAQLKENEHRQAANRRAEYNRNAERTLREMRGRLTRARLDEIREVVATKSKEAGYELVVNASELSLNVVYSAGKNDLTDEIIATLNKDAPEEYKPKKPIGADGTTTPTTPATPPSEK